MTYTQAYKELNNKGIIDNIINNESAQGAYVNSVKVDIIDAINYYVDFVKTSSFKQMKYWWDKRYDTTAELQHKRITKTICTALAEIELAKMSKYSEQLQYLIDSANR